MQKVLVLGGNIPHKRLIEKLKERGFYTILVDYLDNPPAKVVADIHYQKSILDIPSVMEVASKEKPDYIMNLCVDRAMVPMAYVAEKMSIKTLVDYETALNVTDKCRMKNIFMENGIKTSRYLNICKESDIEEFDLKLPVVVKPADASGSIGVKKICSEVDLKEYLPTAFEISRSGEVVIEEFTDDLEVSIDCFVYDDQIDILLVRQKMKNKSETSLSYPLGSIILKEFPNNSEENIRKTARMIVDAFHLKNTPFFLQAFIDRNGELSMIEFGARIGGGMSFQIIENVTGFDIMNASIDCYVGKQPSVCYHSPEYVFSTNYIFTKPGKFDSIQGYEQLVSGGIIEKFVILAEKGHESDGVVTSRNKTAYFLVKESDIHSLFAKVRGIVDILQVLDVDGRQIMNKELFTETLSNIEPYFN